MPKHKYHEMSLEELKAQLKARKEEFLKLRFSKGVNKVIKNPANYKKIKKDIARLMTIIHEKQKKLQ